MDVFHSHPGMRGLFMAGVFSASLSTVSSGMNSMVSLAITDYIKPNTDWSDSRYETASKVLTACLGVMIIATGFAASFLGTIITMAISIVGSFYGAFLGIFVMGIWMPFVNSWVSGILRWSVTKYEVEVICGNVSSAYVYEIIGTIGALINSVISLFALVGRKRCVVSEGAGIGFVSGVAISLATYIGRRVVGKPAFLTRKLSVSTSLCPAGCSYLDSINATSMISRNEMGFTTAQPESTPYAEEYDLSFIENYLSISYLLIPVLGLIISILVGVGVSLLTGGWKARHLVEKSTIDPISLRALGRCMPSRLRKYCFSTTEMTEGNVQKRTVGIGKNDKNITSTA